MLSEDSDTENIHELTINEHFAKAYEYRKEREELAKLKEKYGSDVDEDDIDEEDSEEDESEDEDGEELTPAVDAAILRTLARIRRKDPSIYDQGKDVFEEERQKTGDAAPRQRSNKEKSKPLTIRQHALNSVLNAESRSPSPEPLTHVEEQAVLRKETIAAFHTAVAKDDDDDDFLVPREKTKDKIECEEEEYRAFLEREVGEDLKEIVTIDVIGEGEGVVKLEDREEKTGKKKKKQRQDNTKEKSKEDQDQEFLMNYILNRGWIDRSTRRLPTYKEITSKGKKAKAKDDDYGSASGSEDEGVKEESASEESDKQDGNALDEDEFDEVADRFESSYNFRFEEPDAATIPRYPRNLTSLVRREDTVRKEAREKRKARKEEELTKKKEEVKRMKALKMKEIRAKLEKIGNQGGKSLEQSKALQELDLDGDWDPEAHDRQMAQIYEKEDDGNIDDDEKPQWDDDIDITDIVPPEEDPEEGSSKKSKKKKKKKISDDDVGDDGAVDIDEMDADVERVPDDDEEWDGTEEMRKRKLDEYMDEIYGLEFNDMAGDMPTRFKYTKVEMQTYGLDPVEILMATDAELNSYMGIKKYAPYRKDGKGKQWDKTRTSRLKELKDKLRERGVEPDSARADVRGEKKRKGKKERMKAKQAAAEDADGEAIVGDNEAQEEDAASREWPKGKREAGVEDEAAEELNHDEDSAPAKKKRRRHKKSGHAEP